MCLNLRRDFFLATILLFCGVNVNALGGHSASLKPATHVVGTHGTMSNSAINVPVVFYVQVPKSGDGYALNSKWLDLDAEYVTMVLDRASTLLFNKVHFYESDIYSVESGYGSPSQAPALNLAIGYRSPQQITVGISGPDTTSTAGLSRDGMSYEPAFSMRSRFNGSDYESTQAINNTAKIFLHELAHNMNLDHCNQVPAGALCTDNIWKNQDTAQVMVNYLINVMKSVRRSGNQYSNRR